MDSSPDVQSALLLFEQRRYVDKTALQHEQRIVQRNYTTPSKKTLEKTFWGIAKRIKAWYILRRCRSKQRAT